MLKIRVSGSSRVTYKGAFLRSTVINIAGTNNKVVILPENRLNKCTIFIRGNNCNIVIGKHCMLSKTELWIEDDDGTIKIGENTTMEGGHIAATEGKLIQIGSDCMFSHRIEIRNGDSHSIYDHNQKRINFAQDVLIGDHVWIGADAKVMKGVIIGNGSIVAANSVVTGSMNGSCVYAGIPARMVKEKISWQRQR